MKGFQEPTRLSQDGGWVVMRVLKRTLAQEDIDHCRDVPAKETIGCWSDEPTFERQDPVHDQPDYLAAVLSLGCQYIC